MEQIKKINTVLANVEADGCTTTLLEPNVPKGVLGGKNSKLRLLAFFFIGIKRNISIYICRS